MPKKKAPEALRPGPLVAKGNQCPQDDAAGDRWPNLLSVMYPQTMDGKPVRLPGSLSVAVNGGYYIVTVRCPSEGLDTRLVVETLVDLLDQVERHVSSPVCVWLPDWNSTKKIRRSLDKPVQ